jgi:hypothetical protein
MHIPLSSGQRGADLHTSRAVFGAWVVIRARSADEIEGWIDVDLVTLSPTDLDEIAIAIRRAERGHGPPTPTALAA